MERYEWPGNVRELVHTMESILAVAGEAPIIYPKHLPAEIRVNLLQKSLSPKENLIATEETASRLTDILTCRRDADLHYLKTLIAQTSGNVHEMVRISGLSRAQIYNLMKTHGLNRQASSKG